LFGFLVVVVFLNLFDVSSFKFQVSSFLAGLAFFSFFGLLWLLSKGKWMGFGDAKLALGLGWLLGPVGTFSAGLISFWLGSIVGLLLLFLNKDNFSIKSKIPFAPFLIAGALIVFLFDINVLNILAFHG
jgi:leader peptidase (prepilin peptidase)/N-methyltransferase